MMLVDRVRCRSISARGKLIISHSNARVVDKVVLQCPCVGDKTFIPVLPSLE